MDSCNEIRPLQGRSHYIKEEWEILSIITNKLRVHKKWNVNFFVDDRAVCRKLCKVERERVKNGYKFLLI